MEEQAQANEVPAGQKEKKPRKLTYKQKRFAKAYIEAHGNATEAVRQSYPNMKSPHAQEQMAHRLITQCPNVVAEIERIMNRQGLSVEKLTNALDEIVSDGENATARNQGIRTSLELLRLIGGNSHNVAVQVNIGTDDLDAIRTSLRRKSLRDRSIEAVGTLTPTQGANEAVIQSSCKGGPSTDCPQDTPNTSTPST